MWKTYPHGDENMGKVETSCRTDEDQNSLILIWTRFYTYLGTKVEQTHL